MRLFLLSLLFFCFQFVYAQDPAQYDLSPCGTPAGISPFLRAYSAHPESFISERSSDTLLVGLQLHLLAKDNGIGRISPERLLNALCQLNADYAASGIRFYSKYDWDLIDSTAWYEHDTVTTGVDMMLANNIPDAMNIYFVSDPAGTCGYNLPYGGVAINNSCAGGHTWAHEIGHGLSLPHPFIGWEGRVYSPSNPTPDTLTYDYTHFHDTLDLMHAPLDTALTEYVNGTNCSIASDHICDTPPDYLSYRWDCNTENNSNVVQMDRNGEMFRSDGSLFMSYSFDGCQSRFSNEQMTVMRATLLTEKQEWLFNGTPEMDIPGPVTLQFPINQQQVPPVGPMLQWSSVPGATYYLVQVSLLQSFITKTLDLVVTDTSFIVPELMNNRKYYWRVRPFSNWSVCAPFTGTGVFNTTTLVSATEPDNDGWRCYPSLLGDGRFIFMEMPVSWLQHPVRIAVYDAAGRAIWQTSLTSADQKTVVQLPSENWPAGVYRLVAIGADGLKTQALVR